MVSGEVFRLNYTEVVFDHYIYKGAVGNQNALIHDDRNKSQLGSDSAWVTTWCPIQVFSSFMACTEVNAYLAMKYFLKKDDTFMTFRKNPNAFIDNPSFNEKTCGIPENTPKRKISHILETSPTHATDYDKKRVCTEKFRYH